MIVIPPHVAWRVALRAHFEGECLVSDYSVGSHGYAQVGWHGADGVRRATTAHRAAWVYAHGEQIPDGMTIDHTCKNRRCVRPDHLRMLSNFENARRTSGRDWPLGECVNGHPNSMLRQNASSKWECSVCRKEWTRRTNAKRRPKLTA